MTKNLLDFTYNSLKKHRILSSLLISSLKLVNAILASTVIYIVLLGIFQEAPVTVVLFSFILIPIFFFLQQKSFIPKILKKYIPLHLDIKYPKTRLSPYSLDKLPVDKDSEWMNVLSKEINHYKNQCLKKIQKYSLYSLQPLLILAVLTASVNIDSVIIPIVKTKRLLFPIKEKITLTVENGLKNPVAENTFILDKNSTKEIPVLKKNLLSIKLKDANLLANGYQMELKTKSSINGKFNSELYLGLNKIKESLDKERSDYRASFSSDKTVYLFLPEISKNTPLAKLIIEDLPVPEIDLKIADANPPSPWPDEDPLPLMIRVKSKEPIDEISLLIKSNNKVYVETVNKVLTEKTSIVTDYMLLLDTYVSKDIDELVITAKAVDKTIPFGLEGFSKPIKIKTASAYGRYIQTLQKLKSVKSLIDNQINSENYQLSTKVLEETEKAHSLAIVSPFFDSLDRFFLTELKGEIEKVTTYSNQDHLSVISEDLSKFLFEHEIINDRERDRDFFIAARTLSRIIDDAYTDQEQKNNVAEVIDRISAYTQKRQERWQRRIEVLKAPPKGWDDIQNNPITNSLKEIKKDIEDKAYNKAKNDLTQTVSRYQNWITELEKKEDEARKKKEQERQQKLSNALEKLKQIQKDQSKISMDLDKALTRPKEELSQKWQKRKDLQDKNIEQTSQLALEIQRVSPVAAKRMQQAKQTMEKAKKSANGENFVDAETYSDFSNRLLRQARSEANKSKQRKSRTQRRRRVMGDNYFGSRVVGGDIEFKRTYQVNKKYREEVLDIIQNQKNNIQTEEQSKLLEDYMFRVVK